MPIWLLICSKIEQINFRCLGNDFFMFNKRFSYSINDFYMFNKWFPLSANHFYVFNKWFLCPANNFTFNAKALCSKWTISCSDYSFIVSSTELYIMSYETWTYLNLQGKLHFLIIPYYYTKASTNPFCYIGS